MTEEQRQDYINKHPIVRTENQRLSGVDIELIGYDRMKKKKAERRMQSL